MSGPKHVAFPPPSFPEKLKQKYRQLDHITYDYLTDLERQFLKAQVEEAQRRTTKLKTGSA